jgi:predicted nucleic acid-binding protein
MTSLLFLDSNILLYSISCDPTEAQKHDRAVALIDGGNNALSVQVLQEFYVQATRPTRPDALPHDVAAGLIRTWLRFKVQEISLPIMTWRLGRHTEYPIGTPLSSLPPVRSVAESCIPKT